MTDLIRQILAWNGAGVSNYSSIIEQGSYEVKENYNLHAGMAAATEEIVKSSESIKQNMESIRDKFEQKFDEMRAEMEELLDSE